MKRLVAITALAATALVPVATAGAPAAPARVQISATEFGIALSRPTIRKGVAIVELVNYGQDDHDLALRRVGGTRTYRMGIVHPGRAGSLEVRLPAGRFILWCTLADHRSRGMAASLRVRG